MLRRAIRFLLLVCLLIGLILGLIFEKLIEKVICSSRLLHTSVSGGTGMVYKDGVDSHKQLPLGDIRLISSGTAPTPHSMTKYTERDIQTINWTHPMYLSNYHNPCWYESLPVSMETSYRHKSNKYSNKTEDPFYKIRLLMFDRFSTGPRLRLRCVPHVYIIGVAKSGTTDLYTLLTKHPQVVPGATKEPMYWHETRYTHNHTYNEYLELFDEAAENIRQQVELHIGEDGTETWYHPSVTVDASTTYLVKFPAWRDVPGNQADFVHGPKYTTAHFIHSVHPQARIIAILRDPTDRLYSEYIFFNQVINRTFEPSPEEFHAAVVDSITDLTSCLLNYTLRYCVYQEVPQTQKQLHIASGIYYPFVRDWMEVFPLEQMKILTTDSYHSNRKTTYDHLLHFIGLEPHTSAYLSTGHIMNEGIKPPAMLSETRQLLNDFYKPYNSLLAQLLQDHQFLFNK